MAVPQHRMPGSDRRQQLLEAALTVFARYGFGGATTKQVAAAANVTEAIVFRHFPSKQALYTAVLDYKINNCGLEGWQQKISDCMAANDDEGLFRAIASEILRVYRTDTRFERLMLFAALEGHELALEYHRRHTLPIAEILREYVEKRQREGALAGFQPLSIIAAIAGMAQHYAMMTRMFGFETGVSDDEAIDNFVRILLKGVQQ